MGSLIQRWAIPKKEGNSAQKTKDNDFVGANLRFNLGWGWGKWDQQRVIWFDVAGGTV